MSERKASYSRKTKETDISCEITPDSSETIDIATTLPFFDHLLHAMAFHGGFGLFLKGKGDTDVDPHHLVEDTGIVLGETFARLVEDHGSVRRYGHSVIPMDDALSEVTIDVCGRPHLVLDAEWPQTRSGNFDMALIKEFLAGLAARAKINLHAHTRYGENSHHMAESLFKALGRALREAYSTAEGDDGAMSTKGTIQ